MVSLGEGKVGVIRKSLAPVRPELITFEDLEGTPMAWWVQLVSPLPGLKNTLSRLSHVVWRFRFTNRPGPNPNQQLGTDCDASWSWWCFTLWSGYQKPTLDCVDRFGVLASIAFPLSLRPTPWTRTDRNE